MPTVRPSLILCKLWVAVLAFWCVAVVASAQSLDVKIKVVGLSPPRVRVEGRREGGASAWSFRNFYGSAAGLAERVENLTLADDSGAVVNVKKIAPGEFTAERPSSRFAYDLKLDPPAFISDAPHISWLTAERGLLMPGDILPLPLKDLRLELVLPAGWNVSTIEEGKTAGAFDVADAERAVFAVGRDLREKRTRAGGMAFTIATAGDWAFSDAETADSAEEILKLHQETFGAAPRPRALLVLFPLPQAGAAGNFWGAETRGATTVLLSGRLPSKLAAKAQLDGALTHELFHLWVPNGLSLEGEYAWFYEGFTNYMALRAGMRRGQLTFNDYLNALGSAYDSYRAARGVKEASLIDASARRWTGSPQLVYYKGLLVAFLYDLALMRETAGGSSLAAVYRELFRRYPLAGKPADGNRALVESLGANAGMSGLVERYVAGANEIVLPDAIQEFGLRVEPGGARTHVGVAPSLDPARRELLRKLGYNETQDAESRKLHERLKKSAPQ
jgi:hypothetical protein